MFLEGPKGIDVFYLVDAFLFLIQLKIGLYLFECFHYIKFSGKNYV